VQEKHKNNNAELAERLRGRPLWQRIMLPIVGAVFFIIGIIGWLFPIVPGFPFLIIGLPMLFCFNRRYELRMRKLLRKISCSIIKKRKKRNEKRDL
jgi:uncharacterized membrane protein YbaN (DUF454 family)